MRSSSVYQIALPTLDSGTSNFNFSTLLPNGTYSFQFSFDRNLTYVIPAAQPLWRVTMTTPTDQIIQAIVEPGDLCGINNQSDALFFKTSLASVGLNDLGLVSMYLIQWTS